MYNDSAKVDPYAAKSDPYADNFDNAPVDGTRGRTRSRSPGGGHRDSVKLKSPPPKRPSHAPAAPNPSNVLGVFGLSIRTVERDLDEEFSRFGRVERVTIVYDQRQSDRSRGFGFIKMATVEDATRCIQELNGVDLNGRRIRVDYSVTDRPHAPTPGEYMGHRRSSNRDTYSSSGRGGGGGGYDRRDDYRDSRDRDRRDRDRDPYGRDNRDWRDRRSPPPRNRHSPDYRRRRSYSRSPPRGGSPRVDYEPKGGNDRW